MDGVKLTTCGDDARTLLPVERREKACDELVCIRGERDLTGCTSDARCDGLAYVLRSIERGAPFFIHMKRRIVEGLDVLAALEKEPVSRMRPSRRKAL